MPLLIFFAVRNDNLCSGLGYNLCQYRIVTIGFIQGRTKLRDSVPPEESRAPKHSGNVPRRRTSPRRAISNNGLVVPQCDEVVVRPLQDLQRIAVSIVYRPPEAAHLSLLSDCAPQGRTVRRCGQHPRWRTVETVSN